MEEYLAIHRAKSKKEWQRDSRISQWNHGIEESNQIQSERISQLESQFFEANHRRKKYKNKMTNPSVDIKSPAKIYLNLGKQSMKFICYTIVTRKKILSAFCDLGRCTFLFHKKAPERWQNGHISTKQQWLWHQIF